MTVKELILRLSREDQNARIVVNGYETGYDEVHKVETVPLGTLRTGKNKNWYDGEFNDFYDEESKTETAILLPRGGKEKT
jgi:hypothetical protein